MKKLYNLILLVICSKIIAVYFLIANAKFTHSPPMIYLAAFFDGLMAVLLLIVYFSYKKNFNRAKEGMLRDEQYVMTDK
jgi:hypothetical protein